MPNHSRTESPAQEQEHSRPEPAPYDDEISLVDLWRLLARRKWWIWGITLAILAAGVLFALLQTPLYEFTSTIDLGADASGAPIEEPEWATSVLEEVLVPIARRRPGEEIQPERAPKVRVTPVADSGFIHLRSIGSTESTERIAKLHQRIAQLLDAELAERFERERQRLTDQLDRIELDHELEIQEIANALQDTVQRRTTLGKQITLLQAERELLEQQLEDLRPLEEDARQAEAIRGETSSFPLAFLPRTSALRMRHSAERALATAIPWEIRELEQQVADLENQEEHLKAMRAAMEMRLANETTSLERTLEHIRDSGVRGELALAGDTPEGAGRGLVVALSLVLGLMLGVFGAFFREFLVRVNETDIR